LHPPNNNVAPAIKFSKPTPTGRIIPKKTAKFFQKIASCLYFKETYKIFQDLRSIFYRSGGKRIKEARINSKN